MAPVVDCHVHVGRERHWIPEALQLAHQLADDDARGALKGDGADGASTAAYLRSQGISAALAIPCGREPIQEYTIEEAEHSDGLLLPLVQYDPRSATHASRRFAAALDNGAIGLKVHPASHQLPPNDPSLYPLYAVAEERQAPVVFHVGSSIFPGAKMRHCDPMLVDEVAAEFPELQVVCAHSGRGFWTDQVFALTRMRPNVWMELSGLPASRILQYFPELDRVADRVLFGSDWPSSPPVARLVAEFRELPFRAETIENALWRNAAKLYRIDGLIDQPTTFTENP